MKNLILRLGCLLIGWNPVILKQCGEASFRQFYKLTSALTIMMMLWFTIGYCFAGNYMGYEDDLLMKTVVGFVFLVIILCIERVIILTVGKATFMGCIRVLLAIVMATLGSTIFDQIIFRNDINAEFDLIREKKIQDIVASRIKMIDLDATRLKTENDSLTLLQDHILVELVNKPTTTVTSVNYRTVSDGSDQYGNAKTKRVAETQQTVVENPLKSQLDMVQKTIKANNDKMNELVENKLNIQQTVVEEYSKKAPGFIEELMATVNVVKQSMWTIIFYFVMFGFLMLLETFVVSIKFTDTTCDYDLIVEHQLRLRKLKLQAIENGEQEKYVTKQYKNEQKETEEEDVE